MGDDGSTVLGATVAIALLNSSSNHARAWSALAITFPLVSKEKGRQGEINPKSICVAATIV